MTESLTKLPNIAAKHSFKVDVEAGKKYSWCTCGMTKTEPFCDGAHKAFTNADGTSIMKSLKFEVSENKTVFLCGCKHTKTPPFCDSTHRSI